MLALRKAFVALWLLCFGVVYGSLVDDIIDAIEHAATCASCHALLVPLQGVALLGDSAFISTFTAVCKGLGVEDDDVCEGIVAQQAPILRHDINNISAFGQTATKLCDALLGLCQPPDVNKWKVPFPKAAPAQPKVWTSKGATPFQVTHFSDVHIDRQYASGTEANCTKPICCRNYADSAGKTPKTPAGPSGSHQCDTPTPLIQNMLKSISANNKFSIFTGDVVEAAVWLVTKQENTNDMNVFNNELATLLGVPVYPAVGNHEAAPVNCFPRNTTNVPTYDTQWVFDTQASGWNQFIGSAAADQVKHFSGSYAAVVPGTSLRIISINTVYWYKANFWLFDSDTQQPDPNGILAFTIQQLQAAEDAGQRAWIIGHMPPGCHDTLSDQSNYFDQIIQRYKNTIAAQFYGHTHVDQFEIAYSDYSKQTAANAVSVAHIAPAVTPRSGNPAFKVYDIDPDTYEVMDAKVYRANLESPTFQSKPTWDLYYSARQTYGPLVGTLSATQSLNPAFWHGVTEAFAKNDTAFQQYNSFLTRGFNVQPCTGDCKDVTICGLRALRAENNCVVSSPGLNFKRRTDEEPVIAAQHAGECEGANLGTILAKAPGKLNEQTRERLVKMLHEALIPEEVP